MWTADRKPDIEFGAILVLTVGLCCALASAQEGGSKPPLAGLPSAPSPHMAKIDTLGDNTWLHLGSPEPDPKWGKARGRSWSSNQPAAADLGGMFVFGEGVHAYTKPDGHYMNDLWFYDINAHRWVCVYPGIEVKTIAQRIRDRELVVDDAGLLVDKAGHPVPPLLIHAYGYLEYEPGAKRLMFFGRQFGNYFTTGEGGVFAEANQLFQERRRGKDTPLSPFFYNAATGRFECFPVIFEPKGQPYGANVLAYIRSRRQFFYGGSDTVWYFDATQHTWTDAKPTGTPPTGIDHCAAYDAKRDRVYYLQRDGKSPEDNFLIFDVKRNEWSKPRATGPAPLSATSYESIVEFDTSSDMLVVIRLYDGQDGRGPRRGVYAYDPQTNAWVEPLPLPPEVAASIKNGNYGCYDPASNAYYCHFASDSRDDGTMWAYRFRKK